MTKYEEDSQLPKSYAEQGRYPTVGDRALVVRLGSTAGFMIKPEHLEVRQEGVTGTVRGYVPGHGGDVWWVHHDESPQIGAYSVDEIAQISRDLGPVSPEQPEE